MIAEIEHLGQKIKVDLSAPLDISMPLIPGEGQVSAWYVGPVRIEPVKGDGFIGDVNQGGSVNFRDIYFNPHGHGTHTECVGHISKEAFSVNRCLTQFMFTAELVSIQPEQKGDDQVITLDQMKQALTNPTEAIVIRTLPNPLSKLSKNYSNTNPPYLEREVIDYLLEMGVDHLLIDQPSVDREEDGGVLAAHHAFWNYPEHPQTHRTITEFIFVPDEIADGPYLLNIQMASFDNDASPSKPVLYSLIDHEY